MMAKMEPKKFKRRRQGYRFKKPKIEKKTVSAQFEMLFNAYLQARKRFFEKFDAEKPNASLQAEKSYYEALDKLRSFEKTLAPDQASQILHELRLENTYSSNRGIPLEGIRFQGRAEDPHFLKSQQEASYLTDKEETVGSLDDYKKYKGL